MATKNLSKYKNGNTAKTCEECAAQRAEYLATLNVKTILELCVGPSLKVLEKHYRNYNLEVTGNDIDLRWKRYYPSGNWLMGDALSIYYKHDAVIFAPPLTRGCSGRRADALQIFDVLPKYTDFLTKIHNFNGIAILVLPARAWATKWDREQYHHLLHIISAKGFEFEIKPLVKDGIRKYIDLLIWKSPG